LVASLLLLSLSALTNSATPMTPVRIMGSYGFYFDGRGIFEISSVNLYTNLFSKIYVRTDLRLCEGAPSCMLYYEGIMNFYPAMGSLEKFLDVRFRVLTTVPPRYRALTSMLGPFANELFVMCIISPRPDVASKTVAGSIARFLSYNMRTFYLFAVAPYNVQLRVGDTVTLTYFISTSPADVSLYGRRMIANQPCPWGSLYYAPVPDVYNVGGVTNITMQWGWATPNAIKPAGYWDYPRPVFYVFSVKGGVAYPVQGTYSQARGPSGLITVPPLTVNVAVTAYPSAVYNFRVPTSYVGAVLQSFEVSFARKCPGDVDLDGNYTMKDFEVVGCLTGLITNRTYCRTVVNMMPPQLKNLFSITGDVNQDGVLNANDALVLLSFVGRRCPAADYVR